MNKPEMGQQGSGSSATLIIVLIVLLMIVLALVCGGVILGGFLFFRLQSSAPVRSYTTDAWDMETIEVEELPEMAPPENHAPTAPPAAVPAVDPIDPIEPSPPDEPIGPDAPTESAELAEPLEQDARDDPAEPMEPMEPDEPAEPAEHRDQSTVPDAATPADAPEREPVAAADALTVPPSEIDGVRRGDQPIRRTVRLGGQSRDVYWVQPETDRGTTQLGFAFQGQHARLRGTAAVADGGGDDSVQPSARFRVYGDGNLLWQSETLTAYGTSESFDVAIGGLQMVALVAESDASSEASPLVWTDLRVLNDSDEQPAEN